MGQEAALRNPDVGSDTCTFFSRMKWFPVIFMFAQNTRIVGVCQDKPKIRECIAYILLGF